MSSVLSPDLTQQDILIYLMMLVGIIVSLLVYRFWRLSAGGAIVPGAVATAVLNPQMLASLLGITALTYLLLRLVVKYSMPQPRYLYRISVITSSVLCILWNTILDRIPHLGDEMSTQIYAFIVPGLIAYYSVRQGALKTIGLTIASTIVTVTISLGVFWLLNLIPNIHNLRWEAQDNIHTLTLTCSTAILLILTACVGMVLERYTSFTSAGVFIAGLLVISIKNPYQIVTYIVLCAAVYGCAFYIVRSLNLFGKELVIYTLFVGLMVGPIVDSMMTQLLGAQFGLRYIPLSYLIGSFLVIDLLRKDKVKTLAGTGMMVGLAAGLMSILN